MYSKGAYKFSALTSSTIIMGALCVLLSSAVVTSHKAPSYLERWQLATNLLSQANTVKADNILTSNDRQTYETYLDLSPAQFRQAVLETVRSLQRREGETLLEQLVSLDRNTTESPAVTKIPPWLQNATASGLCLNHTVATIMALQQKQMWALQMLDAMGKLGPALLQGNFKWPGAYDECLSVRAHTNVTARPDFSGQYCDATISLDINVPGNIPLFPGQQTQAGTFVYTGICIPDSCADWEMTLILSDVFIRLGLVKAVYVNNCSQGDKPLDTKAIVAIIICSIFLALLVVGTAMDILYIQMPKWRVQEPPQYSANTHSDFTSFGHRGNGTMANGAKRDGEESLPLITRPEKSVKLPEIGTCTKVLVAFSVYTNGAKLLSTQQAAGSLTCVHGVRFLSMTWVVLGHTFLTPMSMGANVIPYLAETTKRWTFQAITNALVSVDSFFVLSGLLVTYLSLKEMKKNKGKLNWFLFFFHRFWRLTPAYMLVIMVYVCLSPYWGEGPLSVEHNPDRDNCENNWWTNLLYINNVVRTKEMCLGQSWYLANDMQFYILSPLIFVPLFFSPFFGMVIAGVFLVVTTLTPIILTAQRHYPTGLFTTTQGQTSDAGDWAWNFYMKPYTRMGAYIVGMLAGYFLYTTDCKLRINKVVNLCIWAVATAAALAVLYGLYHTANGHPMPVAEAALYNGVHRQVWSLCLAWVIVACVTGNGGFVNTILSWPAMVPLSRLTYCIYLLHLMILDVYMSNARTLFYVTDVNMVMLFLGVLVVSYMAGFVTSLAFEAPWMGLEKVLLHKDKKGDKGHIRRTAPQTYDKIPEKSQS